VGIRRGAAAPARRRAPIAASIAILAAGAALYWYWPQISAWVRPQAATPAISRQAAAPPAVPVSIVVAARQDVPVYLTGLGAVQASFTVRIHAQVDGTLQTVQFTEGQHVKKGDVLAKIDGRLFQAALDQAKAKKAQDDAQLIGAEKDLVRAIALAQKNFGSQQNVDQQQAKVDQFKAAIAADEASIATAQTQLDYTTITAPNDGRIGIRLVDPGNLVRASDPGGIANLALMQPSAVVFTLPSRTLDDVREAIARGPVEVVAFDQNNRRALATGTLLMIDNAVDQATSTIRLKAMFPNKDERLWPGDFVNARLLVQTLKNVVAVPSSAVQRGPQGLFAWIVTADNTAEPRAIEVGPTTGNLAVIAAGVNDGERVITDGQYKLRSGATVSVNSRQAADGGAR
jgi:multidrug efflux system membrane fusion protein